MALAIEQIRGGDLQVETAAGDRPIFSLDGLRARATPLRTEMIGGSPALSAPDAELLVWAAFAAARGYAIEHGLIERA